MVPVFLAIVFLLGLAACVSEPAEPSGVSAPEPPVSLESSEREPGQSESTPDALDSSDGSHTLEMYVHTFRKIRQPE